MIFQFFYITHACGSKQLSHYTSVMLLTWQGLFRKVIYSYTWCASGGLGQIFPPPYPCKNDDDCISTFCLSPWWRHQMETFSALLALCAGNSPVTGEFPHKGQWRGALMFSLICTGINGWVNNHEAGDLRRYRAHYDVIVMTNRVLLRQRVLSINCLDKYN